MLEKDKFLKKQINLLFVLTLFGVIFFSKNLIGQEINFKIKNYIKNLGQFSSRFVQSNGEGVDEGYIYIYENRLRIDYIKPDRTLKISEKKGVYINHELREEEFFSTKNNIVRVFYDIFLNDNFFISTEFEKEKGEIIFRKQVNSGSEIIRLIVYFEINPLVLRKITAETESDIISISFNEHKYNNVFEKDFFSFLPIYLD